MALPSLSLQSVPSLSLESLSPSLETCFCLLFGPSIDLDVDTRDAKFEFLASAARKLPGVISFIGLLPAGGGATAFPIVALDFSGPSPDASQFPLLQDFPLASHSSLGAVRLNPSLESLAAFVSKPLEPLALVLFAAMLAASSISPVK